MINKFLIINHIPLNNFFLHVRTRGEGFELVTPVSLGVLITSGSTNFFFFLTCLHKREIQTSDLRFIRRGLSRLSYLLRTLNKYLVKIYLKNTFFYFNYKFFQIT
jgi:hypothetical protein